MIWRRVRSRGALVGGWIAAAALLIGGASSAAQGPQAPGCGPVPPGVSVTFDYEAPAADSFTVPAGVHAVAVTAQGGHGGSGGSTAVGGPAGLVDATIRVTPGECLSVYVAGWGGSSGGYGWARGGDNGNIGDEGTGSSGAGGGGASALVRGTTPLVVAGGGGGGGGDGTAFDCVNCNDHQWGGAGGAGGFPPRNGHAAEHANGGDGGRGGFAHGSAGNKGENGGEEDPEGAGGGGGGGFPKGGAGGDAGQYNDQLESGGGGGGGGGVSQVTNDAHALQAPSYKTSTSSCPYKHFKPTCHGVITISWHASASPLLLPFTPDPPPGPIHPLVRVPTLELPPTAKRGLAVELSPGTTSLELELFQRHRGKWRRVRELVVDATPTGSSSFSLTLPTRFRRALLRADRPHSGTAGRLRLDAIDLATGQRVDRQQLVLR